MTTFLEKLKAYYIPGGKYEFPDGEICIFKARISSGCPDKCAGPLGDCNGMKLVFIHRGPACVYTESDTLRCMRVEEPCITNIRW